LRKALACWLLATVVAATFAAGLIVRHGDVSALIHAAPPLTQVDSLPDGVRALPEGQGYDGQFFYRMSISPFSRADRVVGVEFDSPPLRAARIGFPALVWTTSLGQPGAVAWAMVILNVLAIGAAVGATAATLARLGVDPRRSFAVLVLPAAVYGVSMDLADPLALALVSGGMCLVVHRRVGAAAAVLSLAVLVRESTLVVPLVLLAAHVVLGIRTADRKPSRRWAGLRAHGVLAMPIIVYLLLQVWVREVFGSSGLESSGSANFTWPFATLIRDPGLLVPDDSFSALRVLLLVGLTALFVVGAVELWRWGRAEWNAMPVTGLLAAIGGLLLLALQPRVPLFHYRNFSRAAGEFEYLVVVALAVRWDALRRPSRTLLWSLLAAGGCLALWAIRAATPIT